MSSRAGVFPSPVKRDGLPGVCANPSDSRQVTISSAFTGVSPYAKGCAASPVNPRGIEGRQIPPSEPSLFDVAWRRACRKALIAPHGMKRKREAEARALCIAALRAGA